MKIQMQKKLISSSNQYFDNCPICQAMKKANKENRSLSEQELRKAFEKAKKVKEAIVGNFPDEPKSTSNN